MNIIIYNCKHASVLVRMIIDMDHHRLIVIPPLNTVTRLQLQISGSRLRGSGLCVQHTKARAPSI